MKILVGRQALGLPQVVLPSDGHRGWLLLVPPGFLPSISSCPAAERSPAPCASKTGPRMGSEGRPQWAGAPLCSALPWAPTPSPAGQSSWTRGQGAWALGEHLWPAQNRGERQRQSSSLFNKNERTFESSLKIHYAQGIKNQPFHFLVGWHQGQGCVD